MKCQPDDYFYSLNHSFTHSLIHRGLSSEEHGFYAGYAISTFPCNLLLLSTTCLLFHRYSLYIHHLCVHHAHLIRLHVDRSSPPSLLTAIFKCCPYLYCCDYAYYYPAPAHALHVHHSNSPSSSHITSPYPFFYNSSLLSRHPTARSVFLELLRSVFVFVRKPLTSPASTPTNIKSRTKRNSLLGLAAALCHDVQFAPASPCTPEGINL